jgi:hypothetical protein
MKQTNKQTIIAIGTCNRRLSNENGNFSKNAHRVKCV